MRTDALITALAADLHHPQPGTARRLVPGLGLATLAVALLVVFTIGVRLDAGEAVHTVRFIFKFVATLSLAAAAFATITALARPYPVRLASLWPLAVPILVLAAACVAELAVLPPGEALAAAIGRNGLFCLVTVPVLSALPLIAAIRALRSGAPASPGLAGAAAGLLAAGLGATVYAVHCTDDSPLFLALWYAAATAVVTAAGALAGRRWLRW